MRKTSIPTLGKGLEDEAESEESTPKAKPREEMTSIDIPQLSLEEKREELGVQSKEPIQNPNATKSRRAAPAPINPKAPLPQTGSTALQSAPALGARRAQTPSSSTLMPPPSVRPSALKPLPRLNGSLNPPPSSASSLRGPSRGGLQAPQTAGLAPSTSTLPPSSRPSKKVLLDPGHSPLDWANLTRNPPTPTFLRGDTVPQRLVKVMPSQVQYHHGRKGRDAWGTYQGKVYNLSPYMKFHPGGVGELMRGAGKIGEAEKLFHEIHPWVNWEGLLGECLVGILVSEGDPSADGQEDLEGMD